MRHCVSHELLGWQRRGLIHQNQGLSENRTTPEGIAKHKRQPTAPAGARTNFPWHQLQNLVLILNPTWGEDRQSQSNHGSTKAYELQYNNAQLSKLRSRKGVSAPTGNVNSKLSCLLLAWRCVDPYLNSFGCEIRVYDVSHPCAFWHRKVRSMRASIRLNEFQVANDESYEVGGH